MKRFAALIISNPFLLFYLIFKNLIFAFKRISGRKLIVYNMHHDYFFNTFESIYDELKKDSRTEVYFSYDYRNASLRKFLKVHVPADRIIENRICPFLIFNLFITAEVTGPDMPFSLMPTKTMQIYHGIGTYNLFEKKQLLSRFDIHFAVGPQYMDFFKKAEISENKAYKIYRIGYPKTDKIVNNSYKSEEIFKCNNIPKGKPIVLYAPHWYEGASIHRFFDNLTEKLSELDITLLIRPHNYIFSKFTEKKFKERIEKAERNYENIIYIDDPDTQKTFNIADMIITDSHTTAFIEFALTGKPILMFYNEKWHKENPESQPEKDMAETGIKVYDATDCAQKVELIISNDGEISKITEKQYLLENRMIQKYFYNPGKATEKAVKTIKEELNHEGKP